MAGLFGVDDYVADSEDEGIKNFKGRVCALLFHDILYPYIYYFVKKTLTETNYWYYLVKLTSVYK